MRSFKYLILLSCFSFYAVCLPERSPQVQKWSNKAYRVHAVKDTHTTKNWAFNGAKTFYFKESYNENNILHLVLNGHVGQKDIYVVDLGAGLGIRLKSFAAFINENTDVDVRFHLINLRAEKYVGDEQEVIGKSILYNFGNVALENLDEELERLGFGDTRFALALSRWTFTHFVDPLRPFLIMHDRLTENGVALIDSFRIPSKKTPYTPGKFLVNEQLALFHVLQVMGSDFVAILGQKGDTQGLPFIIRRATNSALNLFNYDESITHITRKAYRDNTDSTHWRVGYDLGEMPFWSNLVKSRLRIFEILDNRYFGGEKIVLTPSEDFYETLLTHGVVDHSTHCRSLLVP